MQSGRDDIDVMFVLTLSVGSYFGGGDRGVSSNSSLGTRRDVMIERCVSCSDMRRDVMDERWLCSAGARRDVMDERCVSSAG